MTFLPHVPEQVPFEQYVYFERCSDIDCHHFVRSSSIA